jgi:predicted dehydrogenase
MPTNNKHPFDTPASIIAIGAGNRMHKYLHYVIEHPEEAKVVAVIEPDEIRRNATAKLFNIKKENCFDDYHKFFQHPIPADAVIICTPENEHFNPCMMAIQAGYHVLLEKPIAQTLDECCQLADAARKANVIVGICHVLRYHPYFLKIKSLIDSGELGKIISVSHLVGVGIDRTTHGFVRGIWNKEERTNPMFISKCCHDVDFLLWITGAKCRKLSSFGSLSWFCEKNAPKGSDLRCINCKVESTCPYSAVDLYMRRKEWIKNFDVPKDKTLDEVIMEELRNGRYGRCVYHCDNNVVDHQLVTMELDDDTTAVVSMDIFTQNDHRTTHIKLTEGEIMGDEKKLSVRHFRSRQKETFDFTDTINQPYHAGADLKIMEDFIRAVKGDMSDFRTSIDDSIASHRICYEAERSRQTGKTLIL